MRLHLYLTRRIPDAAVVTTGPARALLRRLGQFLDGFSACFSRQPQREAATQYLDGLFNDSERKSMQGTTVVLTAVAFTFLQMERGRRAVEPRPTLPVVRGWYARSWACSTSSTIGGSSPCSIASAEMRRSKDDKTNAQPDAAPDRTARCYRYHACRR